MQQRGTSDFGRIPKASPESVLKMFLQEASEN